VNELISQLAGPVAVLGGSGFIGSHLVQRLQCARPDVLVATSTTLNDVLVQRPQTIFDCIAYGTRSGQTDPLLMHEVNFTLKVVIVDRLRQQGCRAYIHAGSSVEYGANCSGPREDAPPAPLTPYASAKAACADYLWSAGKNDGLACANLRLYSVYGPRQHPNELVPVMIRHGRQGRFPTLVPPDVSYDYVHVEDVCRAFVTAAVNLPASHLGESFNIGTGVATTINEVAALAKSVFGITTEPEFSRPYPYSYYGKPWFADTRKAESVLGFTAGITFEEGFTRMAQSGA
jgi:dolichol-phosphate mannosyltransferase